jgi:Fe-S oxidoreductase
VSARAGIVVTGTEVLTGRVVDRNGPWCSEQLRALGVDHESTVVVGDRPADILAALKAEIAAGTPVIGLEPACLGTFKDELLNFFPDDADAAKLSKQAVLFSDFLLTRKTWQPRALNVKAIVHGHCHQKSLLGMNGETTLLKKLGVDFKLLNSGCCGMAGSFGFKPEHYEVSIIAGEKGGLLPAVRAAGADTLIITNGYSCREQIAQTGERRALHIAEVARMALDKKI